MLNEAALLRLQKELGPNTLLFPRGHSAIEDFGRSLPSSWKQALSTQAHLADAIVQMWSLLHTHLPRALEVLAHHTIELALVHRTTHVPSLGLLYIVEVEDTDTIPTPRVQLPRSLLEKHQLLSPQARAYLLPDQPEPPDPYLRGWFGGVPATEEDLVQNESRLGLPIPRSYKSFCQVHNSFLSSGLGLKPLNKLYCIPRAYVLPEPDPPLPLDVPSQLLAFCGYGAGDKQCYDLDRPIGKDEFETVWWDHEGRDTGAVQSFWDFADEYISDELVRD